ncbi:MAG: helix-turn-helix transcriptional regulator [Firmicutes bacterium]|nr:helix-turn-helix transcriptional regulator [Bacillota bacterium]
MEFQIKEMRERSHLTQEELAKRSGVSRQLISMLENGRLTVTKTDTLVRLAKELGCKVQDLFLD